MILFKTISLLVICLFVEMELKPRIDFSREGIVLWFNAEQKRKYIWLWRKK